MGTSLFTRPHLYSNSTRALVILPCTPTVLFFSTSFSYQQQHLFHLSLSLSLWPTIVERETNTQREREEELLIIVGDSALPTSKVLFLNILFFYVCPISDTLTHTSYLRESNCQLQTTVRRQLSSSSSGKLQVTLYHCFFFFLFSVCFTLVVRTFAII